MKVVSIFTVSPREHSFQTGQESRHTLVVGPEESRGSTDPDGGALSISAGVTGLTKVANK